MNKNKKPGYNRLDESSDDISLLLRHRKDTNFVVIIQTLSKVF